MLSGQFDLASATETVALPSNTDVASFTDTNLADTASSFTATIDWGDGATTTGTVVGSNGDFTVQGGHTYADEGTFAAGVSVVRTADNSHLTIQSAGVPVQEDDNITGHSAPDISGNPGQALTNVKVATFTDTNTVNDVSDFTVAIDWGDGTTTSGTLTGSAGNFTVTGSHTYANPGNFTITTFMNDDPPGDAVGVATTQAGIGFGGTETLQSATEFVAVVTGTQVATFVDNKPGAVASDYTVMIDWGDGTTTGGTVSGASGSFTVTSASDHSYADEGNFTLTAHITRTDSAHVDPSGTVAVAEGDVINASGTTIHNGGLTLSNVKVATFSDTATANVANDFIATIDWGDGTSSAGTISGSNGAFSVNGSHTYAQGGQYDVSTLIGEDPAPGATATDTAASTAIVGLSAGTGTSFSIPEGGATGPIAVATFNDGNTSDQTSDFTATINWGDGTTTTGVLSGGNGSFTVSDSVGHTYADEGNDTITTTVTRTADHAQVTMTGTATVNEADTLAITPDPFGGNPGQPFTNVQVATFTTNYLGNVATDFSATIDWGDGATSAGMVSGGNGNFTVTGSHTYANGGNETFHVTVVDDPPGTATITGTGTATINFAGQMVLTSATEHVALPNNTPIATFTDSNGGDTPASFTAMIDWGDGTASAGTVAGGGGTFTIEGGHTYADEGNDVVKATLVHTSDQSSATVSGSVTVAEHDVLTGHATAIAATQGQAFNGTVATFSDTDMASVPGDFIAAIDWGDGTSSTGTVSGGNGTFTVSGSHTYAATGQDNVTVVLSDDAPGTATASAASTATVAAAGTNLGAGDFDTDGDKNGDLLWLNPDGTVVTWDMNGAKIESQTTLGQLPTNWHLAGVGHFNPGPSGGGAFGNTDALFHSDSGGVVLWQISNNHVVLDQFVGQVPTNWHIVGLGDFNGDGATDVAWQSDAGQMLMWEMNGPHVIVDQIFGQAPAGGHAVAVADFNNDGKADILFQTDTGNVVMWEMNGTQIIANQTVGQIPSNWHFATTGDFNGDGKADILFRSDAGQVLMWEMNGTQVIANQLVGQVPTNWHVSGAADVNGDGRSDVIFTSNAGAHQVWEMNGTNVIADQPIGTGSPPASPPLNTLPAFDAPGTGMHAGGLLSDGSGIGPAATGSAGGGVATILSQLDTVHDQHFIV